MKDPKHGQLMLEMASADLQAIRHMLDPHQFADSIFGFHLDRPALAEQVAELDQRVRRLIAAAILPN